MVDLELWKNRKKQLKLSLSDIANLTDISISTLKDIFRGATTDPRIETVQRIERALGLEEQKTPPVQELTEDEQEIFTIISQLTDEEIQEARAILQYILNKRA